MNILLTGNKGYIGSALSRMLAERNYSVTGFDSGYFSDCEFVPSEGPLKAQITKDIRAIDTEDLKDIDVIIHLAALSNDPLGSLDPKLTDDINFEATIRLAELARKAGIRRFLYASSCSMYGIAKDEVRENSELAPVTEYAISKVKSEDALRKMAGDTFSPVYLRASTAYGVAPLLRCDLVVNNLTGWACTTGKIRIMSDGSPWRPTIHVEDLASAYIACLEAPVDLVHNEAFNVGRNSENYRIKDLAEVIKGVVPGCEVEYTYEHGSDSRTYKVNFDKIATVLKDYYHPQWNVGKGARQLYEAFTAHNLTFEEFTGNKYIRLNHLKYLMELDQINANLFWK